MKEAILELSLTEKDVQRFWKYVEKGAPDECWKWTSTTYTNGYGSFRLKGKTRGAHRISFMLTHGPFPEDKPYGLHRCDNPICVNPNHIFPGTQQENLEDMRIKGRIQSSDLHWSRRSPEKVPKGDTHWNAGNPRGMSVGSKNPMAKLNEEIVSQIRSEFASGVMQRTLARKYNVTESNISLIVRRLLWV